ncbi:MAG: insulinase family protein [Erysipelotrichia bacterium]|nr:insulinase family protein [Erysipelotrichia bacterium]NCC54094.1 insulinase family protein [Erysipelotrichia bacterium]
MNKIVNERFHESYIEETLDNGLKVILWEKKDFAKSFFLMATPLGALDLNQVSEQQEYHFPAGIAHFLEHKMLEDETQDVMDVFAKMGANVNAFTSYSETAYYFSTANDPIPPLNLLLDFVQSLNISEASVEKEKGIIIQELEMYQQMSEVRIINETLSSLFTLHPLIHDIGGDKKSVNATTKVQLEQCYALNYHPSKMILIGVSGKDSKELLDVIKANQAKKTFPAVAHVERKKYEEPNYVKCKEHKIQMEVSIPKVTISFKMKGNANSEQRNRDEWCYKMLFDLYFSSLNPNYQKWIDEEIINPAFSFEIDLGSDYGMLMFYGESEKIEAFEKMIFDTLQQIEQIDEKALETLRHRYFGVSINALNDHKQIAVTYMRNYFANLDFFEAIEVVETIKAEDLIVALKNIDLDNYSKVVIEPIVQNG